MPSLTFEDKVYARNDGETVLNCLLRHGVPAAYSCKSGVCQSCMMQSSVAPPEISQTGLKDTLKAQHYFLACICMPAGDFAVSSVADAVQIGATIQKIVDVGANVLQVFLSTERPLQHRAGQYLTLLRKDGLARSYSIASATPAEQLELHVRVLPDGKMSGWLKTEAVIGDAVKVLGPAGECFYAEGRPEQPIVMIGAGTGLAPLYGILQDALSHGHTGPLSLYHGARIVEGLYFVDKLRALAQQHPNFHYHPCVLDAGNHAVAERDILVGSLDALVLARQTSWAGVRSYVCGDPKLVRDLKRKLIMAGASNKEIFADAFLPSMV
jgi:CDP-4-dehydro-6-deoxyglucose reductase